MRRRGTPLVVGTTGPRPRAARELERLADRIPLLIAANFSKAVNLLMQLVGDRRPGAGAGGRHRDRRAAPPLQEGRPQRHGPAAGRDRRRGDRLRPVRPRPRRGRSASGPGGEIGLHALRTGDNPGEHTVVFGLMGECLELSHRALNRDGFARGALDAARFLAGKPPGLYSMDDLLQLGGRLSGRDAGRVVPDGFALSPERSGDYGVDARIMGGDAASGRVRT